MSTKHITLPFQYLELRSFTQGVEMIEILKTHKADIEGYKKNGDTLVIEWKEGRFKPFTNASEFDSLLEALK